MTVPQLDPYQGLGGYRGGHWQAGSQAQSSALNAAYTTNLGAIGTQAAVARPDPVEDAGIRAGEIEAVRVWILKNGYLWSMFANHVWSPGAVECGKPDEGTGIHAFKTVGQAMANYGTYGCDDFPLIIGSVLLWGTVIEHEKGYRAEFSSIKSLDEMIPTRRRKRMTWFGQSILEPDLRLEIVRRKYLLV